MEHESHTVALFADMLQLQSGLSALRQAGFDTRQFSVIGKNQHREADVTGLVVSGSGTRCWGRFGLLARSMWWPDGATALLLFPGVGQVVVVGPLVHAVGDALEGDGASALGSTLAALGLPADVAKHYDTAIRAGRLALVAHGAAGSAAAARRLLVATSALEVRAHAAATHDAAW